MTNGTATGHRKLLMQLEADGMTTMFGNPGSSEEGLLDEVGRFPALRYVLGLQEAALILMAAGYGQATQRPTAVQLHCSVGLGNALGSLFHVFRKQRTPLVVMTGEAAASADALEAHMWLDLVRFAQPVTKYACRASHPASVLRLLRRCVKISATPPFGPTLLVVPQDILDQQNTEPVVPTVVPDTRVVPEQATMDRAADMLAGAENPVILMGDGVSHAHAQEALTQVAEALGAGIYGAMASEVCVPWTHPLYRGLTGHMFGSNSRRIVADADAVVICGTYVFPDVFPVLDNPFRPDARVVHIDLDTYAIGKNHPVTMGLASDPQLTLSALAKTLHSRMSEPQKTAARQRCERIAGEVRQARERAIAGDGAHQQQVPLYMAPFAQELAKQLPPNAIIYDESLTHTPELTRYVVPTTPGNFFQTPGGTLGVAFPGAIGVALAHPGRTVVGLGGDGGAMYTLPALWTAAHYKVGAKFVVCHNRSYRLLKQNLVAYWQGLGEAGGAFPAAFDVHEPVVDYVSLAKGLGVPGVRVEKIVEIAPAIQQMLAHDGPFLIELVLESDVQGP